MIRHLISGLAMVCLIGLNACELINPDEAIPAYVQIDTFRLETDLNTEGFASQKITDAWIFFNDVQVGAIELPVLAPVFNPSSGDFTVQAGIKEDGISGVRTRYPFYEAYIKSVDLHPTDTVHLEPVIHYLDNISIFTERFEVSNDYEETSDSDTSLIIIDDPDLVFEGTRSAAFFLEGNNTYFEMRSGQHLLGVPGAASFLELDYKNNDPFDVRIRGNKAGSGPLDLYVLTIAPKDDWNKIYINLTDEVGLLDADTYEIVFVGGRSETDDDVAVYLDNIKLLHQ